MIRLQQPVDPVDPAQPPNLPIRIAGVIRTGWRWVSADEPLRGAGSTLAAELFLTAALAFSAPAVRRLPGDIYLYLFIVFWSAYRWGFPHAVFGVACSVLFEQVWLPSGALDAQLRALENRQLIIFAFVALGISAILSAVRRQERTLQRDFETQREVALIVQQALLPDASEMPGWDVAFEYHPASRESNVGGDFLDVFSLGDRRFGILLGDVTGHGVGAAVQTAEIRYGIRALAQRGLSAAECISTINEVLRAVAHRERYATAFFGIVDSATGALTYCNAGQDAGLVWRGERGSLDELSNTGTMLGIAHSDSVEFAPASTELEPGDGLVLYSDGIPEARGPSERYGLGRLEQFILKHTGSLAAHAVDALYTDVETFAKGDLGDDVAVLWIRRLPIAADAQKAVPES